MGEITTYVYAVGKGPEREKLMMFKRGELLQGIV